MINRISSELPWLLPCVASVAFLGIVEVNYYLFL